MFDECLEPRCLGNYRKSRREAILKAAEETGKRIEWIDEPDHRMDLHSARDEYGSIWSYERGDLSDFWRAYSAHAGLSSDE